MTRELRRADAQTRRRADAATGQPSHSSESARLEFQAASLSPADKVVIAYLTIIAALIVISSHRIPHWRLFVAVHILVIAIVLLMARWSRRVSASPRPRVRHFIRGWYPVVLIPTTFKELSYLIPLLHPRDFDWELAEIDLRMFGIHPTVWLERVTWPALTEVLQVAYATYYFWPIVLGAVLWGKGWFEKFHFFVFVIVLGFYLSYLGYIAVPSIGPRFILADQQTKPLTGLWSFQWIRMTLDRAEGITRDCFPSGHTAVTLIVLCYSWQFHRRTFWWILPAGSALIISTVYLRYHYVIDIIAGALLAAVVILMARPLYRALDPGPRI